MAEAPARAVERPDLVPVPLPDGINASDFDISLQYNARVQYWLEYFQHYRGTFSGWLERMARYEPFIRTELTSAGLPGDLIYLALIESGFVTGATSSARAVGIWQFMPETARQEGMEVSTYIDERRDPIRATQAAVHHLKSLYRELGSWYLVAAAYNSGSGRIARALDAAGGGRGADSLFWRIEPVLPGETRDYVPKFLAASIVAKYPTRFGVTTGLLPRPDEYDIVRIARATDLAAIARAARTEDDVVRRLNPQFYRGVTPPGREVSVRVPAGHAARVLARLDAMPRRERVHDLHYAVQDGDTPAEIADRYGISLVALRRANHLKKKTRHLAEGRELVIPLVPASVLAQEDESAARKARRLAEEEDGARKEKRVASADAAPREETRAAADDDAAGKGKHVASDDAAPRRKPATAAASDDSAPREKRVAAADVKKTRAAPPADEDPSRRKPVKAASADEDAPGRKAARARETAVDATYRVRPGDTLGDIADAHGLSLSRLRALNDLEQGSVIHPGQTLRLRPVSKRLVYHVRPGDTLSGIARKHGVSVQRLRDWNGLAEDDVLHPGDAVELHLDQ